MIGIKKIYISSLILLSIGCREKYVPQINEPVTGYLVVEGFINSGAGATTITLSRVTNISTGNLIAKETKANVRVEGKANTTGFLLTESVTGTYSTPQLNLNVNDQYRIYIKTAAGKEYVSDYSIVRNTPDIDSISWRFEKGLQLYANAHDDLGKTRYYRFSYDETWEFHSRFQTSLKFYYDKVGSPHAGYRDSANPAADLSLYKCWQKDIPGNNVLVGTTENLLKDALYMFPITHIDSNSIKLGVLYSINLSQYAVSKEAFKFYEQLRKNTENLGSIFDPQPSDNTGNLHCITNPNETAIGFVEVSQGKQKRIFISNGQLPNWGYDQGCSPEYEAENIPQKLTALTALIPTRLGNSATTIFLAEARCVDCTLRGSNVKPPYWP